MDLINTNNESESQRQPWLEFRNLGAERKVKTKLTMMDFVRTDFSIFRDLLKKSQGMRPWREEEPKKSVSY